MYISLPLCTLSPLVKVILSPCKLEFSGESIHVYILHIITTVHSCQLKSMIECMHVLTCQADVVT